MADFDPVLESSRYTLGEADSFYGVWDTQGQPELVEQFPLSQEGFERAEAKFRELTRRDRRESGVLHRAFWGVLLVGLALSFLTGLVDLWGQFVDDTPVTAKLFQLSFGVGELGQRMALGGLAALAGLTLLQRHAVLREEHPEPTRQDTSPSGWEDVARWAVVVAVPVWMASALVTYLLYRPAALAFPFESPPDTTVIVAYMVESLAYRIWVGALALLAVAWGRRLLLRRDGRSATRE